VHLISATIIDQRNMNKELLIEELKNLGFNEYKAKVFLVLASGKIMSASEIIEEAHITRGTIYDILKSFVAKGYCNEIETNKILQYQIIDPDIILDKVEREYNETHVSTISQLKKTFGSIKNLHTATDSNTTRQINIELIRGYNKHRISKYMELLKGAKTEICGMYRFKGLITEDATETARKFIENGGKIKSIYKIGLDFKTQKGDQVSDASVEDLIKVCEMFRASGEDIRLTDIEIPNMTIIDRDNVFINLDDKWVPKQNRADMILRHSSIAQNMFDLFMHYWDKSLTIEEFKKKEDEKKTNL